MGVWKKLAWRRNEEMNIGCIEARVLPHARNIKRPLMHMKRMNLWRRTRGFGFEAFVEIEQRKPNTMNR